MTEKEYRRISQIGGKIKFIDELTRLKKESTGTVTVVTLHKDVPGAKTCTEMRREIALPAWLTDAAFKLFINYREQLAEELGRYDITKEEHQSPEDFEQSGVVIEGEGSDDPDNPSTDGEETDREESGGE